MMIEYIKAALTAISLCRDAAKTLGSSERHRSSRITDCQDLESLVAAVFSDQVRDGDVVSLTAVLSRYANFYKPRAFPRLLVGEAAFRGSPPQKTEMRLKMERPMGVSTVIPAGSLRVEYVPHLNKARNITSEIEVELRPPFLPAGTLPKVAVEGLGRAKICFLYPIASAGLLALPPISPGQGFYFPESSKGVPILLSEALDARLHFESVCKLKAVVRKGPDKILDLLSFSPLPLRRQASGNFYRPDSATTRGFFLEAIEITPPTRLTEPAPKFEGNIFLESHIEGMSFEDIRDLVQPHALDSFGVLREEIANGFSPALAAFDDVHAVGLSRATLVVKKPNYYAIYSTVDLRDSDEFSSRYRYVRRVAEDFQVAVAALAHTFRTKMGIPLPMLKFCHDFLFDYECQHDFSSDGVLSGSEASTAIAAEPSTAPTSDWLRLRGE